MIRAARVCAGTAVVLIAAAIVIGGCGSTRHLTDYEGAKLCVYVGLPTSGYGSVTGRAVLSGLRKEIRPGLDIDGYGVRLCGHGYDAGPNRASALAALLKNAVTAAKQENTIAYVGGLTEPQASAADAVLAQAGIPLITPSGPSPGASSPARSTGIDAGDAAAAVRSTLFYLLPSTSVQTDAVSQVQLARGCGRRVGRHSRPSCELLTSDPFCTGIATRPRSRTVRLCVAPGPDLSRYDSPAAAYGQGAGALLQNTFAKVGSAGGDIANRALVLRRLLKEDLKMSPIGRIRFTSSGTIRDDHFTVYTVQENGRLTFSQTFAAH